MGSFYFECEAILTNMLHNYQPPLITYYLTLITPSQLQGQKYAMAMAVMIPARSANKAAGTA